MKHPQAHDSESEQPDSESALSDPSARRMTPIPLNRLDGSNQEIRVPLSNQVFADGQDPQLLARYSLAAALLSASGISVRARAVQVAICDYPVKPQAHRNWARRAAKLVASMVDDLGPGVHLERIVAKGLGLLRHLLVTPASRWPPADELVRCSYRLRPLEATQTLQGYAHLLAGDVASALRVFVPLLARAQAPSDTSLVEEGAAYGQLLSGKLGLAQAAMERAAEQPSARVSALAWSLHLALRVGVPSEIEHSAARLDLLVASSSTEFSACLGRMRKRKPASTDFNPWPKNSFGRARMASIRLTQWARENRSSSGRVARAMG